MSRACLVDFRPEAAIHFQVVCDAQRRPCQRGSRALKTLFPHRHAGSTTYLKSRFQH